MQPTLRWAVGVAVGGVGIALWVYRRRAKAAPQESLEPEPPIEPKPPIERLDRAHQASRCSEALIDVAAIGAEAEGNASDDASLRSWTYPKPSAVPGACSRKMAETPFDAIGAARATVPGSSEEATLRRLRAIRAVCRRVADLTSADWCGVYEVVPAADHDLAPFGGDNSAPNLLKLAYIGSPSRPYFPLTPAFAEGSNNSTVAMSGNAVVYHDVLALPIDSPYYVCDAKVRAEACVPIFAPGGSDTVIGIMDVESFTPDVFRSAEGLGAVLAACEQLSQLDMLRPKPATDAGWEAHACRMPPKLTAEEKSRMRASISLADRSGYFAMSCCPITPEAEQRMEAASFLISKEEYNDHWEIGRYACARCGHVLYENDAKFVGPCLWPSFRKPSTTRSWWRKPSLHTAVVPHGDYNHYTCEVHEVYCAACRLFLGHAFEDGATSGDVHPEARWRHCVLSLSLKFSPRK